MPAHRDHDSTDLCHEFVWFRTNLVKPFFMLDPASGRKDLSRRTRHGSKPSTSSTGAEATGRPSISLRVDGIFSDALRRHIPFPRHKAAAPAHFARLLERDA